MGKILLVDDDKNLIELIKIRLESANYEVTAVLKEEEAIESAADKDAALVAQKNERLAWLSSAVETIGKAVTPHELKTLSVQYLRDAARRNETAFIARINKAVEERKATLEKPKEDAA